MSKSTGLNLFGDKKKTLTAVEIFTEGFTIGVGEYSRGENDEGEVDKSTEPIITFACNEGKGTGAQVIPLDELAEVVVAYQEIVDSGFNRPGAPVNSGYVPTYENVRHSWHMVRPKIKVEKEGKIVSVPNPDAPADYVSVRVGRGQGAKPIVVHKDEFVQILEMLKTVSENSEEYVAKVWEKHEADKAKAKPGRKKGDKADDSRPTATPVA